MRSAVLRQAWGGKAEALAGHDYCLGRQGAGAQKAINRIATATSAGPWLTNSDNSVDVSSRSC